MNMHVLIVVYYAIIKMVIGKHLMSGKIFYDILGWGQLTCSFSNQPPSFSALSHLLGNYFLTLWHSVVPDNEKHQQNTKVWVQPTMSQRMRVTQNLFIYGFYVSLTQLPPGFHVVSFQGSPCNYFLENCFQATRARFAQQRSGNAWVLWRRGSHHKCWRWVGIKKRKQQ